MLMDIKGHERDRAFMMVKAHCSIFMAGVLTAMQEYSPEAADGPRRVLGMAKSLQVQFLLGKTITRKAPVQPTDNTTSDHHLREFLNNLYALSKAFRKATRPEDY